VAAEEVEEKKEEQINLDQILDHIYGILDQHKESMGEIARRLEEKKEDHQAEFSLRLDGIDVKLENTDQLCKNSIDNLQKKIRLMWIIIAVALIVQVIMTFVALVF